MANKKPALITDHAADIIKKSAEAIGAYNRETYSQDLTSWMSDVGLESPIEQQLLAALVATACVNCYEPYVGNDWPADCRLIILPQYKIKNYRVDFMVKDGREGAPLIVVEADGHDFHDRSEPQRRQEKRRDRDLAREGYTIYHFTGSEIYNKPWDVALEIFQAAAGGGVGAWDSAETWVKR